MKKIFLMIITFICFVPMLVGCSVKNENESYLRIHIRANSNLSVDQNIKYEIKDEVVNYLTPIIAGCESLQDVKNAIKISKNEIENICDKHLVRSGFNYKSTAKIQNEYFPTRAYGEYVLKADFYDALIIELGEAKGDNWWCVVYPPLCFLNAKETNTSNIKYKSKLYELINKFFD